MQEARTQTPCASICKAASTLHCDTLDDMCLDETMSTVCTAHSINRYDARAKDRRICNILCTSKRTLPVRHNRDRKPVQLLFRIREVGRERDLIATRLNVD